MHHVPEPSRRGLPRRLPRRWRIALFVILGLFAYRWLGNRPGPQEPPQKPPFTIMLPTEFNLVDSFSHENPSESSLTRIYFLVKPKGKQVEEMLILQVADKTNPQASPMTAPPLKPYTEKRLDSKGKVKKGELEVDYLIQLMAWNPSSPSLQPLMRKGVVIPSHWAIQGQLLFIYLGEHAAFFRYSQGSPCRRGSAAG